MDNKESEVQKLIRKIETLIYNLDLEDYEKRILQAIIKESGNQELQNLRLSLAELHVIDCIERNEMLNTTAIAAKLNITKGGISKITAKLIKKGMIETQRRGDNLKEVYFTVKPLGKKIFSIHEKLHKLIEKEFAARFCTYSAEELYSSGKFLDDLNRVFRSTDSVIKGAIRKQEEDCR